MLARAFAHAACHVTECRSWWRTSSSRHDHELSSLRGQWWTWNLSREFMWVSTTRNGLQSQKHFLCLLHKSPSDLHFWKIHELFFLFFSFSGKMLLSSGINSFLATDIDNKCINSEARGCSLINSYIYLVCSICHFWLVSEPRLFVSMVTWSIMWKAIKIIISAWFMCMWKNERRVYWGQWV